MQDSEIIFDPPFQSHKPGDISLRATIDGWLKDFFATVTCMQRLDTGSGDYLNEIREHFQMLLGGKRFAPFRFLPVPAAMGPQPQAVSFLLFVIPKSHQE